MSTTKIKTRKIFFKKHLPKLNLCDIILKCKKYAEYIK